MEYAAAHDMQIGMVTNYVTVRLPAKAIVESEYWRKAANNNTSFHFIMNIDDENGLDLVREYRQSERSRLHASPVSNVSVELEMFLRSSTNNIIYIEKLDEDVVSLTYKYITNYRSANSNYAQQTLALLWCDTDRRMASSYTTNVLLASHTDTKAQTVEVLSPYAFGSYLLVSESNADNRKTQLISPQDAEKINTVGVPEWAAADVGALQAASVLPSDLSGVNFNQPISRAELAAYLVRALALQSDGSALTNPFNDVSAGHTYYNDILLAYKAKLISGQTATRFAPDAPVTRQEMASLFARAMVLAGHTYSTNTDKLATLADAGQVAPWAKGVVAACLNTGIIVGTSDGRFAPEQSTSWVEAAVMLNRFYKLIH